MDTGRSPNIDHRRLDDLRRGRGPIQEHVIDEFVAGRLSRRDFLRRGSAIGLSMPLIGGILAACGSSGQSPGQTPKGKAGGTIKAGILVPAAAINPLTIADQGGLELIGNVGEFLVFTDQHGNYHPWLAESWTPNADASVWTFKIRQGVKFNDGTPMTADDVVYSFQTQSDPKSKANALSVFGGILDPSGVAEGRRHHRGLPPHGPGRRLRRRGLGRQLQHDHRAEGLRLRPVPDDLARHRPVHEGRATRRAPGPPSCATRTTGAPKPCPSQLEFTFYPDEAPMAAALQAGSIDCLDQFSVANSPQLLTGFKVISLKAATHRELSMRCDMHPFTSNLVRQAIAYTLDRPAIVAALFKGQAQVGNDSPFSPSFPSTDTSVPQRTKNLAKAKQLLAQAGVPRGFKASLLTETTQEIPHFAQIVKQSAAQIGVDINLTIETPTKYYGQAVFGKSDWLDGEMSLVDYGARAVPNVYLAAPLQSINAKTGSGSWNAAHFNNPTYDKLSKDYIAAADPSTQRQLAGQIQRLLLDQTPIIFAYFYNYLSAAQQNVTGVYPTAAGPVLPVERGEGLSPA